MRQKPLNPAVLGVYLLMTAALTYFIGGFFFQVATNHAADLANGGTWKTTGVMATGRNYHTDTLLADGQVLVAGG